MIKHHLRFRNVSTINEGGEKDRIARLQGALDYEHGDVVIGIVEAARDNDLPSLIKALPYLRHVTQDHYLELLNEPLDAAAHANNPACARELVQWGADPNRLFNGAPSSVTAASAGNMECLDVLMEFGCDIDVQSENGFTPLMKACEHGHNEVAVMLIDAGANRDKRSIPAGQTALMIAAERGNVELCSSLLAPNTTNGVPGCQRELKELRVGYTALMFAARRDFIAVVELFAGQNVDLHARDHEGMTAIHHAAHFNRLKTFRYLWSCGDSINDEDDQGRTPLIIAVQRGHRTLVEMCVGLIKGQQGGENEGKSCNDYDSKMGEGKEDDEEDEEDDDDYRRSHRVLSDIVNLECTDKKGRTPLIWAVLSSQHLFVPLLMVEGGAKLDVTDADGKAALDYAKELKLPEMIILLNNCVVSRERRVLQEEARRIREEKEAKKAARRAELSDSEFDFTSSDEDDEDD